jgi:hypothetical protein
MADSKKGFEVRSPLGPIWFVPYEVVVKDYAEFLRTQDGLSEGEALAQAHSYGEGGLVSWFYEQFAWTEIEKLGVLLHPEKRGMISRKTRTEMRKVYPQYEVVEHGLPG